MHVCSTKDSIKYGLFCGLGGGGGLLVSVDDGRGCGMSHIWSCLATARSCFHLTQSACLDFIERQSAQWGRHRGWHRSGRWGGGAMFPERRRKNHVKRNGVMLVKGG